MNLSKLRLKERDIFYMLFDLESMFKLLSIREKKILWKLSFITTDIWKTVVLYHVSPVLLNTFNLSCQAKVLGKGVCIHFLNFYSSFAYHMKKLLI